MFFNYIDNVIIVLNPNSKVVIEDYRISFNATQDENRANDTVDILPPLYDLHFLNYQDVVLLRFMMGDEVRVNFKYSKYNRIKSNFTKKN
jgi:hypothetical protein